MQTTIESPASYAKEQGIAIGVRPPESFTFFHDAALQARLYEQGLSAQSAGNDICEYAWKTTRILCDVAEDKEQESKLHFLCSLPVWVGTDAKGGNNLYEPRIPFVFEITGTGFTVYPLPNMTFRLITSQIDPHMNVATMEAANTPSKLAILGNPREGTGDYAVYRIPLEGHSFKVEWGCNGVKITGSSLLIEDIMGIPKPNPLENIPPFLVQLLLKQPTLAALASKLGVQLETALPLEFGGNANLSPDVPQIPAAEYYTNRYYQFGDEALQLGLRRLFGLLGFQQHVGETFFEAATE